MSKSKPSKTSKKNEVSLVRSSAAEYLNFVAATGNAQSGVEMRYEDENIWLTQKMMSTLYDVSVPAINQHLKRIFADNEQVIVDRADHKKENMGLASWDGAPQGKIHSLRVILTE